ncbi:MAG: glycosyltransferase family 39 protein [Planctomycetota bacterium]|nr:glycosyltransferase family 39 protein [Planctomycetota bacterium]
MDDARTPSTPSGPGRLAALLVLLLLAGVIVGQRIHLRDQPLEGDITTYAVIGSEMLKGRALYGDLWDHKPPGVHVVFAATRAIAGTGPGATLLINLVCTIGGMLGVYAVVRATLMDRRCALWAAAAWTFLSCASSLQANQPNVESIQNLLQLPLLAMLIAWPGRRMGWGRVLAIGLLAAGTTLLKQIALAPLMLAFGAYVLSAGDGRDRLARALRMAAVLGVVVAAWGATCGYFAATGRWGAFYDAVVLYNRDYINREGFTAYNMVSPQFLGLMVLAAAVPAAAVVVGSMGALRRSAEPFAIGAGWAMGSAIAVAAPGFFYRHYLLLFLPSLALSLGWGVGLLRDIPAPRRRFLPDLLAGLVLLPLAAGLPLAWQTPVVELGKSEFGIQASDTWREAEFLRATLRPGERFWNLGSEPGLYYLLDQSPQTGVFYDFPLFKGPLIDKLTPRTLAELDRNPPDVVVIWAPYLAELRKPERLNHPLMNWLARHYRNKTTPDDQPFYHLLRVGSDISQRLASPAPVALPTTAPATAR